MARKIDRLSARKVATLQAPGRHADGGGLYLSISNDGQTTRRRWVFLYRWNGKLTEMGLGSATAVGLAQARQQAVRWRAALADGVSPLDARNAERIERSNGKTFLEIATELHAQKSKGWKNEKVRKQWLTPLKRYATSLLAQHVDQITTEDVLAVLQPIWTEKPETAARVRGRIEATLDAARVRGLVPAHHANPARWRGHLAHLLPKRRKLSRGHHAAMPYKDVPAFVEKLRQRPSMAALALEFTILTAARTGEVLGAPKSEFDAKSGVWIIPASRMKSGREHRVPLSKRAIAILAEASAAGAGPYLFSGTRPKRPLSQMAMEMLLRRMKADAVTVHGFRSSFRDWAGESTDYPRELAEAALAHVVGDETERAYRRADAIAKRREMMNAWESHLNRSSR